MADAIFRPPDDQYWIRTWSSVLFAGDLFAAIPFGEQPFEAVIDLSGHGKHFVGPGVIERYRVPTLDFDSGAETDRRYPRAKVIDMIFFIEGGATA